MIGTHGRARRSGRPGLATALVASGLVAFVMADGRPARACHIRPSTATTHAATATAITPHPASSTPSQAFQNALQTFMKDWHDKTTPTSATPAITPTAMTLPVVPPSAAQVLTPPTAGTPSVPNWHQTTPATCTPPPPPCTCGTTPSARTGTGTQGLNPPTPLGSPSGLLAPTPAPEPSTILSALALVGVVAWRRRATRPRA